MFFCFYIRFCYFFIHFCNRLFLFLWNKTRDGSSTNPTLTMSFSLTALTFIFAGGLFLPLYHISLFRFTSSFIFEKSLSATRMCLAMNLFIVLNAILDLSYLAAFITALLRGIIYSLSSDGSF